MITDAFAARQSYKKFEITGAGHIDRANNPTDGLTNLKQNGVLDYIFLSGQMDQKTNVWIDRSGVSNFTTPQEKNAECQCVAIS